MQWLARLPGTQEIRGSSPGRGMTDFCTSIFICLYIYREREEREREREREERERERERERKECRNKFRVNNFDLIDLLFIFSQALSPIHVGSSGFNMANARMTHSPS